MPTHFERLGLPRRFSIDPAAVEREYLARSRHVHPDFHGLATPAEQQASLEASAALNEAYLTLKDWFRRADYLLTLQGGPSAQHEKNLDQQFLMEMMDLRERIEEAGENSSELHAIADELQSRETACRNRLTGLFAELESHTTAPDSILTQVRHTLNAVKTIRSVLRDLPMV